MKTIKLFNTTQQNIQNKKHNIFIPICIGNKFFVHKTKINEENLKKYIEWALENTHEKILILIADKIQDTNYSVRAKVSLTGARKRVLKDGKKIKENIERFVQNNFEQKRDKIKIISFQEYEENDVFYKNTKMHVYKEFEKNLEFRNTILRAVKTSIKDRVFTDEQYLQLCKYVLDEFSLVYHGLVYEGTHYDMYLYPFTDTVLYFIFDIIYQKRFKEISKKINEKKVATVILQPETNDTFYREDNKDTNVKIFYNKTADIYDEVVKQHCDNRIPQELISFYQANNIHEGKILDLGCGTGTIAHELESAGFQFTFTGIDFAEKMVKYADKYEKVYVGDMLTIIKQFPDKYFDHTITLSSLYFLSPKEFRKLIQEIERVTKKSIFITCEQFSFQKIPGTEIPVWNHHISGYKKSTLKKMWNRMDKTEVIYGYFCNKIL